MSYGSTTKRRTVNLHENDMFTMGGRTYIITEIDDTTDPFWMTITAAQMIGRETWSVEIHIPKDVPFIAQS